MYWFLAQNGGDQAPATGFDPLSLAPFLLIFVLMYFMFIRPQKKQQQAHRNMIANVKKNDRVLMRGGFYATIMNVKDQEDEITIKIDDNRDVKIRASRSYIEQVVTKKDGENAG